MLQWKTHSEGDHPSVIWPDGHEVIRNDCHVMIVDTELQRCLGARIDQSKSMCFASLEVEFGDTGVAHA